MMKFRRLCLQQHMDRADFWRGFKPYKVWTEDNLRLRCKLISWLSVPWCLYFRYLATHSDNSEILGWCLSYILSPLFVWRGFASWLGLFPHFRCALREWYVFRAWHFLRTCCNTSQIVYGIVVDRSNNCNGTGNTNFLCGCDLIQIQRINIGRWISDRTAICTFVCWSSVDMFSKDLVFANGVAFTTEIFSSCKIVRFVDGSFIGVC